MGTYSGTESVKKIYDSGWKMFTGRTLSVLLDGKTDVDLAKAIERLIQNKVVERVERDKYILTGAKPEMFELARFLYSPSYISFEAALNFWGILSQFPYEVTSATPKKTTLKKYDNRVYSYTHLKNSLFFGYEKDGERFLAHPEKALLDQAYLFTKGLKGWSGDEYDLSRINKNRFKEYLKFYPNFEQLTELIKI